VSPVTLPVAPLPICSVPALMVLPPVKVLTPVRVRVPVPDLVRLVVEVPPSWITPLKVVEVLLAPAVNVAVEAPLLVTVPAPASDPIAWPKPLRSSVPVTVNALADENVLVAPACRVPPLMVVEPE